MLEFAGSYASAKVFTEALDDASESQILQLLEQPFLEGSKVRFMPDVHAGKGCTIGTTLSLHPENLKICPNLVGVDIGCGMTVECLTTGTLDFAQLDRIIHDLVPAGINVHDKPHAFAEQIDLTQLRCCQNVNLARAEKSIGSLGSGNHFIEIDSWQEGDSTKLYLVIHSGSRNLGKQVCETYQQLAESIQATKDLAYLEGQNALDYLHDMRITQEFAHWNRLAIAEIITTALQLERGEIFETVHNYIDFTAEQHFAILRKGAVSAQKGEKLIIPMNMRDGSLLCTGKGNADWNFSAPHGAGRVLSRHKARKTLSLENFKSQMQAVYTTCVSESTLDESPDAYKDMSSIVENIAETVSIDAVLKPLYNFKAA